MSGADSFEDMETGISLRRPFEFPFSLKACVKGAVFPFFRDFDGYGLLRRRTPDLR